MATRISTSKKFPLQFFSPVNPCPTIEQWCGGDEKYNAMSEEEKDAAIGNYENNYFATTFRCDEAIFNLEEWADIDGFYPENQEDKAPFDKLYNNSYKVALECKTWDRDGEYHDYAANGTMFIERDDNFYDDLKAISNQYVSNCISAAFNKFLSSKLAELSSETIEAKDSWKPDEWHATWWGSPLDV